MSYVKVSLSRISQTNNWSCNYTCTWHVRDMYIINVNLCTSVWKRHCLYKIMNVFHVKHVKPFLNAYNLWKYALRIWQILYTFLVKAIVGITTPVFVCWNHDDDDFPFITGLSVSLLWFPIISKLCSQTSTFDIEFGLSWLKENFFFFFENQSEHKYLVIFKSLALVSIPFLLKLQLFIGHTKLSLSALCLSLSLSLINSFLFKILKLKIIYTVTSPSPDLL